jgi:hypothetical protein
VIAVPGSTHRRVAAIALVAGFFVIIRTNLTSLRRHARTALRVPRRSRRVPGFRSHLRLGPWRSCSRRPDASRSASAQSHPCGHRGHRLCADDCPSGDNPLRRTCLPVVVLCPWLIRAWAGRPTRSARALTEVASGLHAGAVFGEEGDRGGRDRGQSVVARHVVHGLNQASRFASGMSAIRFRVTRTAVATKSQTSSR